MDTQSPVRAGLIALILIMGVALAILLFNLAPLVAGVEPVSPPRQVVRSAVSSAVSLQDAAERAAERAVAWAPDAVLVRVEGSWYLMPGWEQYTVPHVAWGFYYYAPSERSLVAVFIDDDVTLWVPPFPIPTAPQPLTDYPPLYGPDSAWLTFRASGGDLFLRQHPEAQVNFRLQTGTAGSAWIVSALDAGEYVRVKVDAQTGVVLPIQE